MEMEMEMEMEKVAEELAAKVLSGYFGGGFLTMKSKNRLAAMKGVAELLSEIQRKAYERGQLDARKEGT